MSVPNREHVMINHILRRRNSHLMELTNGKASQDVIDKWQKFYSGLLIKYNFYEVENYA